VLLSPSVPLLETPRRQTVTPQIAQKLDVTMPLAVKQEQLPQQQKIIPLPMEGMWILLSVPQYSWVWVVWQLATCD